MASAEIPADRIGKSAADKPADPQEQQRGELSPRADGDGDEYGGGEERDHRGQRGEDEESGGPAERVLLDDGARTRGQLGKPGVDGMRRCEHCSADEQQQDDRLS